MRIYFDEETDKKLLEAKTEEEVREIIAGTTEAEKLKDKMDLVMAELARIKNSTDEEVELDELDNMAGGAKATKVYLSETKGCEATFRLADWITSGVPYCWRNDFCLNNEFEYHYTKWSNCPAGGKHDWRPNYTVYGRVSYLYCDKCLSSFFAEVDQQRKYNWEC